MSYLQRYEPCELVYDGGQNQQYHLRTHDSLKISNGKWHWYSQGVGGTTALQYLIKVKNMGFVEAVIFLSEKGYSDFEQVKPGESSNNSTVSKREFSLPIRFDNNNMLMNYLRNRGISKLVITKCIRRNLLYESAYTNKGKTYHNCVFVGYDLQGVPRFACLRGCFTNYKQDFTASDKRYSF